MFPLIHATEGTLRAYLDGELPPAQVEQVAAHVRTCPQCRTTLDELSARSAIARCAIEGLSPAHTEPPSPLPVALARFKQAAAQSKRQASRVGRESQPTIRAQLAHSTQEGVQTMFRKNLRPVWATLAVVAIIGILFSFAPVRAAASQFLGLFRVRKFAVVPIDPVALSGDLDSAEAQEQIAKVFSDDVDIMREPSEPISVTTAEEASQLAGLPLRLPAVLAAPDSLEVQDGLELSYRFNAERARAVLDVIGKEDVKIPDGLDGAVIHVDVRPIVAAMFESEKESVMLIQANSPIMDMPPSLDMNYMGEALLQLWGLSPDEARDMAAKIDWTSTLVIPLPAGVASHQEVMVKGEPGLFIQQTEAEHGEQISTLLWQKDGVVYALTGELTIERAQEIANSMP